MRFLVDAFPLIVTVSAPTWDAAEVQALIDGFEPFFRAGRRYAVLTVPTPNAPLPGHAERKMMGEWAGHPRVRDATRRLCVASAVVVPRAIERAVLQIIWAFGKPPCPSEAAATVERGLDFCLERLRDEQLQLPKAPDMVRYETLRSVNELFASSTSVIRT